MPSKHYKQLEMIGVIYILRKHNIAVPENWYKKQNPLKELIKFLYDEKKWTFDRIGKLLGKTPATIMNTYMGKKK